MTIRPPSFLALLLLAACTTSDKPSADTDTDTDSDTDTDTDSDTDTDTDSDTDTDTDSDTDTDTDSAHTGDTAEPFTPIAWAINCTQYAGECATLQVPYDHADPASATFPLPVARIPATGDPADYKGVLVFAFSNYDSTDYLSYLPYYLGAALVDYDVVGFDPRGGGRYHGGEWLGCTADSSALDAVFDVYDGSTDPADVAALQAAQRAFFDDCRRTNPDLVDHMGMNAWADDLESVRIALGVERLSFFGLYEGASMGLNYAERYPTRVDRFVLDSMFDAHGGAASREPFQVETYSRLVQDWAAWCAADVTCAVHDDPMGALTAVLDQARTAPLDVNGRPLTYGRALYGFIANLPYSWSWPYVTQDLAAALDGDGAGFLAIADAAFARDRYGYGVATTVVSYLITTCVDSSEQPTAQDLADWVTSDEAAFGENGGVTGGFAFEVSWCGAFGAGLDPVAAPATGAGAPPYLLLSPDNDAIYPVDSALQIQANLQNASPLMTVNSMGGGALFSDYSGCVGGAVGEFFSTGTLPADGTHCP